MKVCGVEEAGRGPVIGPLVMCGLLVEQSVEPELRRIGAKDSKLLTRQARERLYEQIIGLSIAHHFILLTPAQIDAAVTSRTTNLNWLEAETSAQIINKLKPDVAILDCPSPNIEAYTARVQEMVGAVKLVAEHKADVKYPIVSGASILAKVTRDREIDRLKKELGHDFGSGYPADPLTQAFLREHAKDYPGIFRKSWASYKNMSQQKLGDF